MSNTIDVCQTGYDYEQYQLNELENDNMKLKKKLDIAVKALREISQHYFPEYNKGGEISHKALKEIEEVK